MPTIKPLATLNPPSNSRVWLSAPHPRLPIIATACSDKSVRIYSLQTFQQQSLISGGHKRSIRSCAWKPNSVGESVLATGSFDASAGIWKRFDEGALARQEREVDFTRGLLGAGDDEDEDEEWRFAVVLDGHDSEIKSLCFSPVAPLLATCSRDKSVWIWEDLDDGGGGDEDNFETVAVLQEHEGDVKCVAWHPGEPLLASGSYDDNVRLWREDVDDWACCTLLDGHDGTVWCVEFEGLERVGKVAGRTEDGHEDTHERKDLLELRSRAGPRLISSSDDLTIRIWRRVPKEAPPPPPTGQGRMPSIFKNNNFEEEWVEEIRLPSVHERSIYAVSWSAKSGRVVSCGSDGKIVVYEERWRNDRSDADGDARMSDGLSPSSPKLDGDNDARTSIALTEWVVVAVMNDAHDVFEINHVCWAPRADKGKTAADEEVIVSTGDDGEVKVWTLDG